MKKLIMLFLSFAVLLLVGVYTQPAFAAEETVDLSIQVVSKDGATDPILVQSAYGSLTDVTFGLEGYVYHIFNAEVSTAASRGFINSKSTAVTMVLADGENPSAVYIDTNGEVLDSNYGEELEFDGVNPSKPGLDFTGFTSLAKVGNNEVFIANYTAKEGVVVVTVNDGTETTLEVNYNEVVTLTPENLEVFKYWADADGQFISANPNYAFTALMPVTVTAVYEGEAITGPSVYLSNVTGIRTGYQSFVGYVENAGLTLVEYGILASDKQEVLTLENAEVIPSTVMNANGEFLRSLEVGEFVSFRAYAKFSNGEVVYSDNNFVVSNNLSHHFDFEVSSQGTTYGDSTKEYKFSDLHKNVVDGTEINFDFKRVARNSITNGLTNAMIISPRENQGDGESFIEFNLGKQVYNIEFDIQYWSNTAQQYFNTLELQVKDGNNWVTVSDLLPIISGKLTIEKVSLEVSGSHFRFMATGGESNGNNARVGIDNLKLSSSQNTKMYSVNFNVDNQSEIINVIKGNKVIPTINTEKVGYTFEGWYDNAEFIGTPINLNNPVNNHMSLFAKYSEKNVYQVSFETNGGNDIPNMTVYEGSKIARPEDPIKDDSIFGGWFKDSLFTEEWDFDNDLVENDIVIFAKWLEGSVQFTVTFNSNGGNAIDSVIVNAGELVQQPNDPTLSGNSFGGWYLNDVQFDFNTPITSDITLIAKWISSNLQATLVYGNTKFTGSGNNQNGSHNFLVDSSKSFTATVTSATAYWATGDNAMRLGSGSNPGNITYTFPSGTKIIGVIVYAKQYDGAVSIKVNTDTQVVTNSESSSFLAYEFDFASPTNVITLSSVKTTKTRVQIQQVIIIVSQ